MSWHEDDQFWRAFEPCLFDEARIAEAEEMVLGLLNLVDAEPAWSVLDQAVGVGRHAALLDEAGFNVTGVDRTALYIARAKTVAKKSELIVADMRTFARPEHYDLVINLWTSFGFFNDDENLAVAQRAKESLKPGGAYVLEMMGKEVLAASFQPDRHLRFGEHIFLDDARVEADWKHVSSTWTVIDPSGDRFQKDIRIRCFSGVELRELLIRAGFTRVDLYGDLDGNPYDFTAERLVAVAR